MNKRELQFIGCIKQIWNLNDHLLDADWLRDFLSKSAPIVNQSYEIIREDIEYSQHGYPTHSAIDKRFRREPDVEILLDEFMQINFSHIERQPLLPTICLSHDIDYLEKTLQMKIKSSVQERKFNFSGIKTRYLDSIRKLLELDRNYTGKSGVSTLFLAMGSPSKQKLLRKWLLDPSYQINSTEFRNLKQLIDEFECDVGLHGSFFSIPEKTLAAELNLLRQATGKNEIIAGRQHWLNVPGMAGLNEIGNSGIRIDSSLGWNGGVGFRCGMARAFPVYYSATEYLFELPMLLMDGPLFGDLKLSRAQATETSIGLLQKVLDRNGCVAINWHDRSAHPDFAWADTYEDILKWAAKSGFQFRTITEINTDSRMRHIPGLRH